MDKKEVKIMSVSEQTLQVKLNQLALDFGDDIAISPIPSSLLEEQKKLYLPHEFVKHPFFLKHNSKKVDLSRVGYRAKKATDKLKKNKATKEEINDKSTIKVNINDLEQTFVDEQNNDNSTTELSHRHTHEEWSILGHLLYGLPDEFDGHVWDIIVHTISDHLQKTGKFYNIYGFNRETIVQELIKKGVLKSRGGRQSQFVHDSIQRLRHTVYTHKKGLRASDNKTKSKKYIKYDMSLIAKIYEKGEELPDGTLVQANYGLFVDPMIVVNFQNRGYFIVSNEKRKLVKGYIDKTVCDKISFWMYQKIKQKEIFVMQEAGIKPIHWMIYENFCGAIGEEPREKGTTNYKKSQIIRHIQKILQPHIDNKIVEEFYIQEIKLGKEKSYKVIIVPHGEFIMLIFKLFSKTFQNEDHSKSISKEFKDGVISKIKRNIVDKEILNKLFYV